MRGVGAIEDEVKLRLYQPVGRPNLIYLPGLHGDWTLIAAFRRALGERLRFVEMTYPRTLVWSLEQYAEAIEQELARQDVGEGWLLGESFGSQLVWPLLGRGRFKVQGVVLAGGFVRHPIRWGVRLAERVTGGVSMTLLTKILFGYARVARARFRKSPEVMASIEEFIQRRTELDRQAAKHRLSLIARHDPCAVATQVRVPVYAITGVVDPIVPWWFVRRWLRKHCPALREYKIIWGADHNVLGTAPQKSADQIVKWITRSQG